MALGLAGVGDPTAPGCGSSSSTSEDKKSVPVHGYRQAREQIIQEFDRSYLTNLMERFKGNQSAAAKAAGISRSYLRELLAKHGLL